jgi:hypothetical protein
LQRRLEVLALLRRLLLTVLWSRVVVRAVDELVAGEGLVVLGQNLLCLLLLELITQ